MLRVKVGLKPTTGMPRILMRGGVDGAFNEGEVICLRRKRKPSGIQ